MPAGKALAGKAAADMAPVGRVAADRVAGKAAVDKVAGMEVADKAAGTVEAAGWVVVVG